MATYNSYTDLDTSHILHLHEAGMSEQVLILASCATFHIVAALAQVMLQAAKNVLVVRAMCRNKRNADQVS